jgi:hypothetical protein
MSIHRRNGLPCFRPAGFTFVLIRSVRTIDAEGINTASGYRTSTAHPRCLQLAPPTTPPKRGFMHRARHAHARFIAPCAPSPHALHPHELLPCPSPAWAPCAAVQAPAWEAPCSARLRFSTAYSSDDLLQLPCLLLDLLTAGSPEEVLLAAFALRFQPAGQGRAWGPSRVGRSVHISGQRRNRFGLK